ncbi:MAG: hypothetical protein GWN29_05830, partial [Gammaproteobacteria bacterium]|nr:hypothetical protein [Gammaproteobacteria bacterium]
MEPKRMIGTAMVLCCVAGGLFSMSVLAHHGLVTNGALYLTDDFIELEGELTEVFWRNPHTRARLNVVDDDGEQTIWELEIGPTPRTFESRGVFAEDFIGRVRVAGYRSRRDPESLGVVNLLMPSGQEYVGANRELRWSTARLDSAAGGVFGLGSANTVEAERAADGIFRVWGRFVSNSARGMQPSEDARYLTPRGRELAAAYDPVTQNPELDCRQGMPKTMTDPTPMEIVNEGDRILIRSYEYDVERTVYMDEQENVEPQVSTLGHSVGRWDGDMLVVETTHVDWPYIDPRG